MKSNQGISDLKKTLQIGTSRMKFTSDGFVDQSLSDDVFSPASERLELNSEAELWLSIATMDVWSRAGFQLTVDETKMPVQSGDEMLRPCPAATEKFLESILYGQNTSYRSEWFYLVRKHNLHVPFSYLPAVLDLGTTHRDLRRAILKVIGERGIWLANANPNWSWARVKKDNFEKAFQFGTSAERVAAFSEMRKVAPAKALDFLRGTWEKESVDNRIEFAKMCEFGLSDTDEPFLESLLDDKRREVRQIGIRLLTSLPISRLAKRNVTRLEPLISLQKKLMGKAIVSASPKEVDASMRRDGIGEGTHPRFNSNAVALIDMIAAVPPLYWTSAWSLSPAELLSLAAKSNAYFAILRGWIVAVQRTITALQDGQLADTELTSFAVELIRIWFTTDSRDIKGLFPIDFFEIFSRLPVTQRHRFLSELVGRSPTLWTERQADIIELLNALSTQGTEFWPADLSQAIISRIRCGLPKTEVTYSQLREALRNFALKIDPLSADKYLYGWPSNDFTGDRWRGTIQEFTSIVNFRNEMSMSFLENV